MTLEEFEEASQWLSNNEDKWHMENDQVVWDVPIDCIPDIAKKFFIDREERKKRMKERIRIRKGLRN